MNAPQPTLVIHRAASFLARLRGLLFAPLPAPGHALLLVPCTAVHTAFMRGPIDVVFLDRAGRIRKIVPRLAPWRAAACAGAWQTLELGPGECARLGFAPGMQVPGTEARARGAA